ncbi:MAG: hypothetical protein IIA40_09065, partial [SAR324 cluster bacterium]|nr:hypothetical protein [SAR324 cluster bacterium]
MVVMWTIILFGALSVLAAVFFAWVVHRNSPTQGTADEDQAERMLEIAAAISEGAM